MRDIMNSDNKERAIHSVINDTEKKDVKVSTNEKSFSPSIEVPKEFEMPSRDESGRYPGPYLQTGEVAAIAGVDRQTILRYARTFEQYLAIETTPAGDRRYTETAVRQLIFLINDKNRNNRTLANELEYINSKYGAASLEMASMNSNSLMTLLTAFKDQIVEENKHFFENMLQENVKLLEHSSASDQKYEDILQRQEEAYTNALDAKDQYIDKLKQQLEDVTSELEQTKKKVPFWRR